MSDLALSQPAIQMRPRPEPYPERAVPQNGAADRLLKRLEAQVVPLFAKRRAKRLRAIVAAVRAAEVGLDTCDETALAARAVELGAMLRRRKDLTLEDTAAAFALVREVSGRVLGMKHHDVQLMGAYALVLDMVAEMNTGEGKTLTATLAVVTMALTGRPVHVVTVNDYLAGRDAEKMSALYRYFGLTTGVVAEGMSKPDRQAAYACDITYCTNKELAFDYLKDRLVLAKAGGALRRKLRAAGRPDPGSDDLIMRGLHYAIVDEADSVFIDEASTPLILSGEAGGEAEANLMTQAVTIAGVLRANEHYVHQAARGRIELLPAGRDALAIVARILGGVWTSVVQREDLVTKALTALHVMVRDEHYIVMDGKVAIVDEYTGRVMADRFWSDGLHQMVEVKEGIAPSARRVTLARLTYQRLFRRYRKLSGMTGTAAEIAGELWEVYGLKVARIPTHRPSRRVTLPDVVFPTAAERWQTMARIAERLATRGVPVLIGTRSVAASNEASRALHVIGMPHRVLNAADEASEAEIIAVAGQAGRITVATNMAGRGTDILLGPGVAELGGLHVVMTERHDAARVDRQLAGRSARQGDPGVFFAMLSLEDDILASAPMPWTRRVAELAVRRRWSAVARRAIRFAQWRAEARQARLRRALLMSDDGLDHALAFSGVQE